MGVSGLVVLANALPCTITGTSGNDVRVGNRRANVICLRAGNDYGHGKKGADRVRGGADNDTLIGGGGKDILRGRAGNDKLFVVDGAGGDLAQGGPGNDHCYGERRDRYRGCEKVSVGNSYPKAVVLALVNALGGSMTLGQKAQLEVIQLKQDLTNLCAELPAPPPVCDPFVRGKVNK